MSSEGHHTLAVFCATTYYNPNSLYKNKRPSELYIYNYDSLFHYVKTCFNLLFLLVPIFILISILPTFNRTFLLTGYYLSPTRGGRGILVLSP